MGGLLSEDCPSNAPSENAAINAAGMPQPGRTSSAAVSNATAIFVFDFGLLTSVLGLQNSCPNRHRRGFDQDLSDGYVG